MRVESEHDFPEIRKQINIWRKKFSMFAHDVKQIEQSIEKHIQNHSIALVNYRQTHSRVYLEIAQNEIAEINRIISIAEKMELMSLLSRG
jgi:hypothetical protein